MKKENILMILGSYLIADGLISIIIFQQQPFIYQTIRVMRSLIGLYLIYYANYHVR